MKVAEAFLQSQFEISEATAGKTGQASWREVDPDRPHVLVGHHTGSDHIAVLHEGDPFDWRTKTAALDEACLALHLADGDWAKGAYLLRFSSAHRPLFRRFAWELVQDVSPDDPVGSAHEIIERHRALWRRASGPLHRRQQRGLFGELSVLRNLIRTMGPEVISTWKGPQRAVHDFCLHQRHLEVKTTGFDDPQLEINSVNQLRRHHPPLTLVMVQMREGPGATLPEVVHGVRAALGLASNEEATFEEKLLRAGYLSEHESHYRTTYADIRISAVPIDDTVAVVNEDLFRRPVPGLLSLRWRLDPRFLPFEEVTPAFWDPRNHRGEPRSSRSDREPDVRHTHDEFMRTGIDPVSHEETPDE